MIEQDIVSGKLTISKLGFYLNAETSDGNFLKFSYIKRPELNAIGVNSITEDQMFVLFLDFDNLTEEKVREQLDYVHREWNVSHFVILKTRERHYHVVTFEKLELSMCRDIMSNLMVDYKFKNVGVNSDSGWILRLFEKRDLDGKIVRDRPEFIDMVCHGTRPYRKLSRAHIELYSRLFPQIRQYVKELALFDESHWDDGETAYIIKYPTSHGDLISEAGLDEMVKSKKLKLEWTTGDI